MRRPASVTWLLAVMLCGPGCRTGVSRPVGRDDGMLQIPAGGFTMGCDLAVDSRCGEVEGDNPVHRVVLSAFRIDRTEVSQARYQRCVEEGRCAAPTCSWSPEVEPGAPVVCVTWKQAQAYCRFRGGRLPTEAEWEKAARGSDGRPYPWGGGEPECRLANVRDCVGRPTAVDSYPEGASPYGALNMAGNVSEWVADWYDPDYYVGGPSRDPAGPDAGTLRVQRGGSYLLLYSGWDDAHVASRNYADPDAAMATLGFRCAR